MMSTLFRPLQSLWRRFVAYQRRRTRDRDIAKLRQQRIRANAQSREIEEALRTDPRGFVDRRVVDRFRPPEGPQ